MKTVNEFVIQSFGVVLVLRLWSTASAAGGPIQFWLSDGDKITCVPIQEQISLRNSSVPWNRYPTTKIFPGNSTYDTHGSKRAQQTIELEVGGCPDGTIPVRSNRGFWFDTTASAERPKRAPSFYRSNWTQTHHEWAGVSTPYRFVNPRTYKGTEAFISVWKPSVQSDQEFSLAQLWLLGFGHNTTVPLNTIEVGYQVSRGHYGDGLPRLFVYWTPDSYQNGCYDLLCPGFVQVSNTVLLGGSFTPISRYLGQQYEIKIRVFKDDGTGDWWLQLNEENVGYWPKDLFDALRERASLINWGGEVINDEATAGGLHTRTQMGSGQFASQGFRRAAYQRNLQYIDDNNALHDAPFHTFNFRTQRCYDEKKGEVFRSWGSYFFFGGLGRNADCLSTTAEKRLRYTPPSVSPG